MLAIHNGIGNFIGNGLFFTGGSDKFIKCDVGKDDGEANGGFIDNSGGKICKRACGAEIGGKIFIGTLGYGDCGKFFANIAIRKRKYFSRADEIGRNGNTGKNYIETGLFSIPDGLSGQ